MSKNRISRRNKPDRTFRVETNRPRCIYYNINRQIYTTAYLCFEIVVLRLRALRTAGRRKKRPNTQGKWRMRSTRERRQMNSAGQTSPPKRQRHPLAGMRRLRRTTIEIGVAGSLLLDICYSRGINVSCAVKDNRCGRSPTVFNPGNPLSQP